MHSALARYSCLVRLQGEEATSRHEDGRARAPPAHSPSSTARPREQEFMAARAEARGLVGGVEPHQVEAVRAEEEEEERGVDAEQRRVRGREATAATATTYTDAAGGKQSRRLCS
uniref:Uncharacterized protein n=1 Tax=Setaria italica TaxID=4555 RepID=K3YKB8_SETIT